MKTADQILNEIPGYKSLSHRHKELAFAAMKEYAKQALSMYRSKILHMPTENWDNDFFLMEIEFEQFLP